MLALVMLTAFTAKAQDIVLASTASSDKSYFNVSSTDPLDFSNQGGTKTVLVETNLVVKPRSEASWLSAVIENGVLKVTADANTGKSVREGEVLLPALDGNAKTLKVRQLGTDPAFFIKENEISVSGKAPDIVLNIVSNAELTFTSSDWIKSGDVVWESGDKAYVIATVGLEKMADRTGEVNVQLKGDDASMQTVTVKHTFEGYPSFIVMSDIHFGHNDAKSRVTTSLSNLYEQNPDADLLIVNGDLTQNGNASQYEEMLSVMNDETLVPSEVKRVFVMGNHEWFTSENALDNYEKTGCSLNGYFAVKGYPFIYIGLSGSGNEDYSDESMEFLANSLKDASVKYAGKPIFVFTHIPAYGTTHGSSSYDGGWGSHEIYDALKDYPQVIHFCGHTHYSLQEQRALWQGAFTSIDEGTNDYTEIQPGIDYEGIHPYRVDDVQEGVVVTVEDESNVNIRRFDSRRGEEILPAWDIAAPYDGTNMIYAENTDSIAPVFQNTEVQAEEMEKGSRNIIFKQAKDEENVVLYYNVRIYNEAGDSVSCKRICSRFYLGSEMPEQLNVSFSDLPLDQTFYAAVTAVDPFGNESEPIQSETFDFKDYVPAEGTTLPVADLFDLSIDNNGNVTDASPLKNTVVVSSTAPVLGYDKEYNLNNLKFSDNNYQFYRVDYADNESIINAFSNAFTLETFFNLNTVAGDRCIFSSQDAGGAGFEVIEGKLQFYCHVGGSYQCVECSGTLKPNQRYHAVATYSKEDGVVKLYLDGYLSGSKLVSGDFGFPNEGAWWLAIGGDASTDKNYAQYPMDGMIMAARMYSKAVSRDEDYVMYKSFADLYNPSEAEDTTAAAEAPKADLFDLTFGENGAVTIDTDVEGLTVETGSTTPATYYNETYKRWFAKFSGSSEYEYYSVPYADNQIMLSAMESDFSLETFGMVTSTSGDQGWLSSTQIGGISIEMDAAVICIWACYNGTYIKVATDVTIETGKYYHIVAVIDGEAGEIRAYINGRLAGKRDYAGVFTFPQDNGKYFCVGGDATGNGGCAEFLMKGEIGVARMYSSALTFSQIKKLYQDIQNGVGKE